VPVCSSCFGLRNLIRPHFNPSPPLPFRSIASVGIYNMSQYGTTIWQGLSPHYIVLFFMNHGAQVGRGEGRGGRQVLGRLGTKRTLEW
jgi:hypothetical protein